MNRSVDLVDPTVWTTVPMMTVDQFMQKGVVIICEIAEHKPYATVNGVHHDGFGPERPHTASTFHYDRDIYHGIHRKTNASGLDEHATHPDVFGLASHQTQAAVVQYHIHRHRFSW